MDLLEYGKIVESCCSLEKVVEGLTDSIRNSTNSLNQMKEEYKSRVEEITLNKSTYIANRIRVMSDTRSAEKRSQLEELYVKRSKIQTDSFEHDEHNILSLYEEYITLADKALEIIKKKEVQSKQVLKILDVKATNYAPTRNLEDSYELLSKGLEELESLEDVHIGADSSGTLSSLSVLSTFIKSVPDNARLMSVLVLSAGSLLLLVFNPLVLLLCSMISSTFFFVKGKKYKAEEFSAISKLKYYRLVTEEMVNLIKERVSKSTEDSKNKFDKAKQSSLDEINTAIDNLRQSVSDISLTTKQEIMSSSESSNFEQEQKTQLSQHYVPLIEEMSEELKEKQELYDSSLEELKEKLQLREQGKQDLEDLYFNSVGSGENKIMPYNFLLGFDGYEPITLDTFNYCSHIVSTVIKNKDVFTNFVKMCVMQILATMNPSCVKIYLVDIEHGTSRFGIFGPLESEGIVTIIETKEKLDETLETIYSVKSERDKTVLAVEDDINKYNQKMIDNYGLTLPYYVFISTHVIFELLSSDIYRQLMLSGSMGICVIGLWDKRLFEFKEKDSPDEGESKLKFLNTIIDTSIDHSTSVEAYATPMSSISDDGVITSIRRQEVEAMYKRLLPLVKKARN